MADVVDQATRMRDHKKVLLVDGDDSNRLQLKRLLESHSHIVTEFSSGTSAWVLYQQEAFPFVILGWAPESMTGLELLEKIRSLKTERITTILMLVPGASPAVIEQALLAGADDCLSTPLSEHLLTARLEMMEARVRDRLSSHLSDGDDDSEANQTIALKRARCRCYPVANGRVS